MMPGVPLSWPTYYIDLINTFIQWEGGGVITIKCIYSCLRHSTVIIMTRSAAPRVVQVTARYGSVNAGQTWGLVESNCNKMYFMSVLITSVSVCLYRLQSYVFNFHNSPLFKSLVFMCPTSPLWRVLPILLFLCCCHPKILFDHLCCSTFDVSRPLKWYILRSFCNGVGYFHALSKLHHFVVHDEEEY